MSINETGFSIIYVKYVDFHLMIISILFFYFYFSFSGKFIFKVFANR